MTASGPIWVGRRHASRPTRPSATADLVPAVFLDRDGVLNEVSGDGSRATSPRSVLEVRIVAEAHDAVARLRSAGYRLVVVSNQPDVARGRLSRRAAVAIMREVVDVLDLDGGFVCPHQNADACLCRKPLPGMVDDAIEQLGLRRAGSWLVGDRWVDVAAATAASLPSVLIERAYSWDASGGVLPPTDLPVTARAHDLSGAAEIILSEGSR